MFFRAITLFILLPLFGQSQIGYKNAFPSLNFDFIVEIQNTGIFEDDRLFVVTQDGLIYVFENDSLVTSATEFIDLSEQIAFNAGQELGLLGLAFHPSYHENSLLYVFYTEIDIETQNYAFVIERFSVSNQNPDLADPDSGVRIFRAVKNQVHSNHNGGKIAFGPDGYLYISTGDGGGAGDPRGNGQNITSFFGKLLRIDVDLDGSNPIDENGIAPDGAYEIPSENPFVGADGLDEIFAWGIRNTWKFSFDPPTGRIWAGDVGQNQFEEVNLVSAGNLGWNYYEGFEIYDESSILPENHIEPVYVYDHTNGDLSITGGYVYRGTISEINSHYIFGDFISGRVWSLDYNSTSHEAVVQFIFQAEGLNISTFGQDNSRELYFASYGFNGSIYSITNESSEGPIGRTVEGVGTFENDIGEVNGPVYDIAVKSPDTVYFAGLFDQVGHGINANNIAMWTSTNGWQALDVGVNGAVNTIALTKDGSLIVGGSFNRAGSEVVSNLASFNHTNGWNPLAGGTDGPVQAIETLGDSIVIGGVFSQAGTTEVNNVALMTATAWNPLTDNVTGVSGTNNEIRAIEIGDNGSIYVGGNFGSAGGNPASRIAEWNGNTWSNLGEGTSGFVQAILTIDDHLYAAGNFTVAGSSNANRIALWDQITREWFPLGDGLSNNVNDLATDGTFLYAAGQFTIAFNSNSEMYTVNNLVRWDTLGWTPLGTGGQVGTDGVIHTITQDGVDFFIGGSFGVAGGIGTQNAIFWRNPTLPANNEILSIDPTEKINITVFPNPTASHIVLEPQGLFPKDLILYLTSLSGKRWDLTYLGDRYLDLQKIPDGFYVLHLVSDQKKYHKKVKIIKSQVIK